MMLTQASCVRQLLLDCLHGGLGRRFCFIKRINGHHRKCGLHKKRDRPYLSVFALLMPYLLDPEKGLCKIRGLAWEGSFFPLLAAVVVEHNPRASLDFRQSFGSWIFWGPWLDHWLLIDFQDLDAWVNLQKTFIVGKCNLTECVVTNKTA